MIRKNMFLNKYNFFRKISNTCALSVLPLLLLTVLVIVVSLVFFGDIKTDINSAETASVILIGFSVPMFISLVILPLIIEVLLLKRTLNDLGLYIIITKSQLLFVFVLLSISTLVSYFFLLENNRLALSILFSFITVAISEELYVRGILYFEFKKIWGDLISVILTSFIFAFVYHANSDFFSNLIFRFPLALVLVFVRKKSGNIYNSVLLHYIYNVVVNTF
ncbi:CPBP family intramembrane metalloprotease [Staphylococcus pseudintermedius]|uniref:CPBP family intramembrane glutamic endopeptidase n=1 Tax=Staphylococcus pseudintermedius TaxID=283734 RepID=UPI0030039445